MEENVLNQEEELEMDNEQEERNDEIFDTVYEL